MRVMMRIMQTAAMLLVLSIAAQAQESQDLLTVSGEATVFARPDNVRITVGVRTISPELDTARNQNAATFQRVLKAVEALRYPDMLMKSAGFDLSVIEEDRDSRDLKPPQIVGYRVSNSLTIRLTGAEPEELSKRAANVIDAAARAGANVIGELQIFVLEEDKHKQEALVAAVENAREKAETIAATLGVRIIGYKNVSAQERGYLPRPGEMMMQMAPLAGGGQSTPIEAGLVQITATATLTCKIAAQ